MNSTRPPTPDSSQRAPRRARHLLPGPFALSACLVLGAVTCLATTFLFAALSMRAAMRGQRTSWTLSIRDRDPSHGEGDGIFQVSMTHQFGATSWSVLAAPPRTLEKPPKHTVPQELIPSWAVPQLAPWLHAAPWPAPGKEELRRVSAAGWPFLALYRRQPVSDGTWVPYEGEFRRKLPFGLTPPDAAVTALPKLPIWHGLIVNTLFYAAAWWLVILIPIAARRALRRRRNTCAGCGYDLRGTPAGGVCPECGTPVPPAAVA